MKFGKWLKRQIEQSLREWREQFLRYKELKQFVNALLAGRTPTPEEAAAFLAALDAEIEKISSFFLDMEELFVIRHRQLKEEIERVVARRAAAMASGAPVEQQEAEAEAAAVRREVVYFHGDMVLLLNYSHINYIGLLKILKKYDKRTGAGLLLPAMASLQEQPFFRTETVSLMVRECEAMLEAVPVPAASRDAAREALAVAEESTFRYTVAALLIMQDVRAGSSTRGSHSLPPLDLPDSDWLRSFQPPSPIHIFQ